MFSTWGYSTKNDNKVETKEWKKTLTVLVGTTSGQWFNFTCIWFFSNKYIKHCAMPKGNSQSKKI